LHHKRQHPSQQFTAAATSHSKQRLYQYRYEPNRLQHSFPTRRSSDLAGRQYAMRFNVLFKPFDNAKVRQAVLYGVVERLEQHVRSEEHTSELQSLRHLVCRLLLEKNKWEAFKNVISRRNIRRRITIPL